MSQPDLFPRDEFKALEDDVDAVGRKEVALLLKSREPGFNPEKFDPEDGARWISSCLSPKRRHSFDLTEITLIVNEARKKGSYSYVTWLLNKTYFEPPVPKTYDVEAQKIGLKLEKINGELQKTMSELQSLGKELKK